MKKLLFILIWFFSLIIVSVYTYEHPETIERIIHYYTLNKEPEVKLEKTNAQKVLANSFSVEFSKIISLSEKTAFIVYDDKILGPYMTGLKFSVLYTAFGLIFAL